MASNLSILAYDWKNMVTPALSMIQYFENYVERPWRRFFKAMLLTSRGEMSPIIYVVINLFIVQATVFSSFTLQNNTELPLFCFALSQKPLSQ